jgi:hypothetical protein
LSQNMLANPEACRPLTQATLGIGLALATIGAIGLGCGIARAAPQPPLLVDDPLPTSAAAGPDPTSPVNIANAIFSELNNLLSAVFPGSSSVFMPADTDTSPLSPGLSYPGAVPPSYPTSIAPGQAPAQPDYPGVAPGGYPSPLIPGPASAVPGSAGPAAPGQAPLLPAQPGPVTSADSVPVV